MHSAAKQFGEAIVWHYCAVALGRRFMKQRIRIATKL